MEPENFPGRLFDRFPNGEMIGYRNDNDSPKAEQKDYPRENLEKDISNKQHTTTLEEIT